jgi:hypothetical protein
MADTSLTAQRVRELLDYDPATGVLTRRVPSGPTVKVGDVAGTLQKSTGYRRISIDGVVYREHRIIWLHVFGTWPTAHVDHINGIPSDNRIANLRDVEQRLNNQNRRAAQRNNASGRLGVYWKKSHRKWVASIRIDGVLKQIGMFDDKEVAHTAYLQAKRKVHASCTV